MKRTSVLALLGVTLQCLPAGCASAQDHFDPFVRQDPYDVCQDQGMNADEFNRCISAVYLDELRKTETLIEPGRFLEGAAASEVESSLQCRLQNPCMFDPHTGMYQECRLLSATEQCLQFAGPCRP